MVQHKRHLAKALSWRAVGTLDTFILAWLITGSIELGALVGGTEILTKTFLYYVHERVWYKYIHFGVNDE
jgi:uncharacterized membrane protein|tara:strand:- start:85 stop:294 length:210 start_codon:yes stop_codon:yes gene_type:complete